MPESSLAASWDELRRRVARERGYNPDTTTWTPEQTNDVNDILRSGARLFYKPRPISGPPHEWSFLRPVFQLTLASGVDDVDLPADFGFLMGDLYFLDPNSVSCVPLQRKNDGAILMMRQQSTTTSGQPQFCAIVGNRKPGILIGQRFQLMLYPTPNAEYTVQGRYSVLPDALDITHPYPYGGAAHAETLIQACLAASEQYNKTPGPAVAHFAECLAASIEYDRRVGAQSIDNEDGNRRNGNRNLTAFDHWTGVTTYNGQHN